MIKLDRGKKKTPIMISAVLLAIFVLLFAGAFIYLHAANSDKTLIVYFTRVGNTDFSDGVYEAGEIKGTSAMKKAYEMGKGV